MPEEGKITEKAQATPFADVWDEFKKDRGIHSYIYLIIY